MAKALGRGLGNLIPGNQSGSEKAPNSGYLEIRISEITLNPNQPRKTFHQDSITELSETIKAHGVIQPIVVKKTETGYELVSGERRLRASKEAGFVKIPAVIKSYSEKDSRLIALIENIQREDLNPIDEALAFQEVADALKLKITDIAQKTGKNRSTVSNLIRLLQLPDSVKEMIKSGRLSEGQARPLLSLGDRRKIEQTAEMIIKDGMTVRQIEEYVSSFEDAGRSSSASSKTAKKDPSVVQLENRLRKKISGKVAIQHNDKSGKGKITINYNNLNDLDRILDNLGIK